MATTGIIAEYNPFHYGHRYQIRKARERYGDDAAVVVAMSGNFVQRGEPSIVSKWTRCRQALSMGADLVLEIPFTFACAPADRFAHGAVSLLSQTGVVGHLFFGSESDDLPMLRRVADRVARPSESTESVLRENLSLGLSYAAAREDALIRSFVDEGDSDAAAFCRRYLSLPNVILGLEYLAALTRIGSSLRPAVLGRQGAGYHDSDLTARNASASAIRSALRNLNIRGKESVPYAAECLAGVMPPESLAPMLTEWSGGVRAVFPEDFYPAYWGSIRAKNLKEMETIAYMSDQLAGRLRNAAEEMRMESGDSLFEAFRESADTKRFAGTRISRAEVSLLVGQRADDLRDLAAPAYIRVLGFSDKGRYLLKLMSKASSLPVITKASDFREFASDPTLTRMAELDLLSSDLWCIAAGLPVGDDFSRTVLRKSGRKSAF